MIIVKNRELLIPLPERYLGTSYDTSSEIRQFRVPRFAQNGTDLSPLTFYVDLLHADGSNAYDTITMGEVGNTNYKVVDDNYIILTWYITRNVLQNPGALFVQLRAMDSENTVRWGSYKAVFYVERHLNAPGNYGGSLTLIEQIQQDHQYMKGVVDELKANIDYAHDAEAWAKGTRSGSAVPSTDPTYHNNSKYYSEQANTKATQAANSATAAANSATQAAETVADTNTRFNNAVASVTSDTEVIDARVGADGTVYPVLKNRLDAEHTDVKSALEDSTIQVLTRWEQGFINADGTEQASTTYCRSSGYYAPKVSTLAVISNPNSHTVAMRRWLANGTYDGSDTVTNYAAFIFLPGYKYRAVDVSTGNPADVTVTFTAKSAISVPNIYDDINGFKQNVLNTDNVLILSELMAEGMYYSTRPVADAICTFFKVPVTSGVTYNFGSAARYVSKDGAILASAVRSYTVSASDGNYIYVTFYNANRANWAICESTVDISTVGTYDNPVIKQGALKAVYDSLENLANTIDTDIEYDGYQRVIPVFTDGKLISKTSGSEKSAQNYSATDYISVREYMKYTIVTVCANDASGYSFYDENHAVIWGQFGGLYESGAEMHSFTVTAPRKAKYIRYSCLTVNKADSYFVTEDLIGSLENYTDKQIVRSNTPVYWTSKVKPPYWIFLLDAARKYFTIANIKAIIDLISAAGFNQFMMHFSTDAAFRLELADMSFVVNGTTYDLSQCLGGVESPDLWYDQDDMDEIISYCHTKGIDFVPLFDMPGHMGKILSVFTDLRYPGTTNLLNIKDSSAVAFAKAVADRYTKYFASRGCHCYNMGYDELPNLNSDTDTNGFQDLYNAGEYHYVVDFGNEIADLIKQNGLIPRIFNEAVYFENDYKNQFSLDFEVMHWYSQAAKGNASAQALQNYNYKLINTSFFLYWILGNPSRSTTVEYINGCNLLKHFYGGTLAHNAYGATLCAWCDGATTVDVGDGGDGVVTAVTPLIAAFGNAITRALNE